MRCGRFGALCAEEKVADDDHSPADGDRQTGDLDVLGMCAPLLQSARPPVGRWVTGAGGRRPACCEQIGVCRSSQGGDDGDATGAKHRRAIEDYLAELRTFRHLRDSPFGTRLRRAMYDGRMPIPKSSGRQAEV